MAREGRRDLIVAAVLAGMIHLGLLCWELPPASRKVQERRPPALKVELVALRPVAEVRPSQASRLPSPRAMVTRSATKKPQEPAAAVPPRAEKRQAAPRKKPTPPAKAKTPPPTPPPVIRSPQPQPPAAAKQPLPPKAKKVAAPAPKANFATKPEPARVNLEAPTAPPRPLPSAAAPPSGAETSAAPEHPERSHLQPPVPGTKKPETPAPQEGSSTAADSSPAANPPAETPAAVFEEARPPAYGQRREPRYPRLAVRRGYQGTVLLRVHILADGKVNQVEIKESSGHAILDRAAVRAVKKWRFIPARANGDPVASWALVPIRFQLK